MVVELRQQMLVYRRATLKVRLERMGANTPSNMLHSASRMFARAVERHAITGSLSTAGTSHRAPADIAAATLHTKHIAHEHFTHTGSIFTQTAHKLLLKGVFGMRSDAVCWQWRRS
jgi:hypothetical protein